MKNKKLVLFDIDGTLIYHIGQHATDQERLRFAIKKTWNVDIDIIPGAHEGWTNRGIVWDLLKMQNISRQEFDDTYVIFQKSMHAFLEKKSKLGKIYESIADAQKLVEILESNSRIMLGLLTGNVTSVARWKLHDAGYQDFAFGVFGEEADNRIELAKLVFVKAKKYFGNSFSSRQIIIIGDTILDVQCGKAIGAQTVAVTTGKHHTREMLMYEKPDLLVDSLMDERVLSLLGLP